MITGAWILVGILLGAVVAVVGAILTIEINDGRHELSW